LIPPLQFNLQFMKMHCLVYWRCTGILILIVAR